MAYDSADAGQGILIAAIASKDEIAFSETRSDASIRYFSGKVFSFKTGASVGSVVPATSLIEVTRPTIDGAKSNPDAVIVAGQQGRGGGCFNLAPHFEARSELG
jgi:hypothetical protein